MPDTPPNTSLPSAIPSAQDPSFHIPGNGAQPNTSNGVHKVSFKPLPDGGGHAFDENSFRRTSPGSEHAVTSSDDEPEQKGVFFPPNKNSAISQLSSRRPSYAAEFHTRQRTYSMTGGIPLSPTSSHPAAPQGDTATWAAGAPAAAPNVGGAAAAPALGPFWGAGSIWNTDASRKSPPKGLKMPPQAAPGGVAAAAAAASSTSSLFAGSEALPSPTSMPASNGEFPIPIPLQPQFRNYRSMSFSVGQKDSEDQARSRLSPPAAATMGGSRQSGLQHRPSRPSLLSEEQFPGTSSPLRSVFETADEENDTLGDASRAQTNYFPNQLPNYSRAKYDAMRLRNRSASAATIPAMGAAGLTGDRIDEYESALAEDDDLDFVQFAEKRRFSEAPRAMSLMYSSAENQRLENLRRQQHWQSGGMFGLGDPGAQSRRHSFAGLEAELGSSGSDLLGKRNVIPGDAARLGSRDPLFAAEESRLHQRQSYSSSNVVPTAPHHLPAYAAGSGTTPPPPGSQRSMMALSMHAQPRSQQLLYFVTFKACRGDVFYVQEGTGLRVRVGDLVIVEADRGTDLGTVIAENITWQKAKELKEHYAKEQYNVLMMYASRRSTAAGAPPPAATGTNGMGNPAFPNGNNAAGAPGSHGPLQAQDTAAELKPKMIKRLAQPHEIQTLREKEANEAKAKRVCQQKVLEHRLPMEILDAEFQMDWKKLTFYYFADSYINFNSLVTDLFKVYKTRIWMSAMNPASFAHPAGLHAPGSGVPTSAPPAPEAVHDTLGGQYGQQYSAYALAGSPSMLGSSQRGLPSGGLQQHVPATNFSSRHSPHLAGNTDFNNLMPQSGFNPAYFGGMPGMHSQPGSFPNGDRASGANDVLVGLQGLSLNTH